MVCWFWILRITDTAMSREKVNPPRIAAIATQCQAARNGIQTIHTYLETQLPFAYVHLIAMLVNLNNIVVCVICGVKLGEFHRTSNTFGILSMALQVLVVPTIYQGLLSISVVIYDPFGPDVLDFPVVAYAKYVADNCYAAFTSQEHVPALDAVPPPDADEGSPRRPHGELPASPSARTP